MPILPFLIMDTLQAARFREETASDENKLEPREIIGGPKAGKWALPRRVMEDPAFEDRQDMFLMLDEVALDTDEAWPPEPEEE